MALRQGPADRRRADGEDPHDRVDAGHPGQPAAADRHGLELVGRSRPVVQDQRRPRECERGYQRHHRLAGRAPGGPVLAHRGFRRRLPAPPAHPRHDPGPQARRRHAAPPMPFDDTQGSATRDALLAHGIDDWLYSFGKQYPGAITLRNYPKSLRQFRRLTGEVLDLATRDIVRDRERGVPLYNRFRELLRMTADAVLPGTRGPSPRRGRPHRAPGAALREGRHQPRGPHGRDCWPRRCRPGSGSAIPRSGSSS